MTHWRKGLEMELDWVKAWMPVKSGPGEGETEAVDSQAGGGGWFQCEHVHPHTLLQSGKRTRPDFV